MERYLSDQLIEEVAHEYRATCPDAPAHGRAAIITAGVPGAGKSVAVNLLATDHRRIDPDDFKDLILIRLHQAGFLDYWRNHVLTDGKPVLPSELRRWVQNASTEAANRVRAASLRLGENFVMEGTLSWTCCRAVQTPLVGRAGSSANRRWRRTRRPIHRRSRPRGLLHPAAPSLTPSCLPS
ncbi:hypothetical protein MSAR_46800 [Mycolicibacterium sarraceniae]|uniref:UDP-N-acetylglucosamine kinase n=1 Tax=Mycolicibacterium sarraceniae TaxID=1534348 RepID=A0A7I7SWZ7_9MYCO|nr:hypothetical protein MSAR_46800 [Mycolicibacterium sarraceniae]